MWRQRGIALLVCMMLLIIVMLLGVSGALLSLQGEKAARGERDRDVAFVTAEETVADAERDIRNSTDPARRAAFVNPAPGARAGGDDGSGDSSVAGTVFAASCGAGDVGLRARAPSDKPPVWQVVDLSGGEDGGACTAQHGAYTSTSMPTGEGFLPFKKPRYLIERMECHQPGDDAAAGAAPSYCYRVTAIGFGARPGTEAVLQTIYSRPEGEP